MSGLHGDQLDGLRSRIEADYRRIEEEYRQAEQDYRLDMAAIEHLQRRFFGGVSSLPTSTPTSTTDSAPASNDSLPSIGPSSEPPTTIAAPQYTPALPQSGDLEDSLRSMFTTIGR